MQRYQANGQLKNYGRKEGVLGYTVTKDSLDINSGVEGIILLRRYENPSEVLKSLREKIAELEETELPQDVKLRS